MKPPDLPTNSDGRNLVTHHRAWTPSAASTRDAPRATPARGGRRPCDPRRFSGSWGLRTTAQERPPGWLSGIQGPNKTSGGFDCGNRARIVDHSACSGSSWHGSASALPPEPIIARTHPTGKKIQEENAGRKTINMKELEEYGKNTRTKREEYAKTRSSRPDQQT